MANYQSAYTGAQIDAAVGAVQTAVAANGIVNTNGLNTILGNYLTSSSAASTYEPILTAGTTAQFYRGDKTWSNTFTGNIITTADSGDRYFEVKNNTTGVRIELANSGSTNHGLWSSGYWSGSAYTASSIWMINRDSSGKVVVNGNCTGSAKTLASFGTVSGSTHAAALKTWFDSNKSSEPRNQLIAHYSSAYGNGSICMGYFLTGYDSNPYGGFFCCQYNSAKYAGIQNGTYTEYELTKSAASSKLIKENISPMKDEEAQKILNITPVSFDYKKDFGEKNQFGFIAEELCDAFAYPVICKVKDLKDLENDPTSIQIDYIKFIPHLVKMIQIQQKEIDELREKVGQISKK